jgi:hypothetical protein
MRTTRSRLQFVRRHKIDCNGETLKKEEFMLNVGELTTEKALL